MKLSKFKETVAKLTDDGSEIMVFGDEEIEIKEVFKAVPLCKIKRNGVEYPRIDTGNSYNIISKSLGRILAALTELKEML